MSARVSRLPLLSALLATLSPARAVTVLGQITRAWQHRRTTRRALALLDQHLLRDIGLTGQGAEAEISKPFWRD